MSGKYTSELELLRRLVLEGGQMLLSRMGHVGHVGSKQATELVTELDKQVEDHLLAHLSNAFPDDTILAEESGQSDGSSGRTWYIDPLDGTTNYAHGHPFFSISLACADAQGLQFATVFAPYLDELYQAEVAGPATLERPSHGQKSVIQVSGATQVNEALLATGFPYIRDDMVDENTNLVRDFLKAKCHGIRRGGSAAVDLVHVAAGKLDGYWEKSLRPWDTAGGTLIARCAGAIVSDYTGAEDPLHFRNIVAASPDLHAQMVARLKAAAKTTGQGTL